MKKLTKEWLQAALVRAIKTIAQTMLGMITVGAALNEVNWIYIFSVAIVAGIVSILTSIAGLPETTYDGEVTIGDDGLLHGDVDIDGKESVRLKLTRYGE